MSSWPPGQLSQGEMALQPDPTRCRLPSPGAPGTPTAIKEQSKHLFLDFTASHNLGVTYGDILNFTPLPATCSQYLVTPLPVPTTYPLPIWWPQICPCFSLVWNVLFSFFLPFLIPIFQVPAQILPLPQSFPAMISKLQ